VQGVDPDLVRVRPPRFPIDPAKQRAEAVLIVGIGEEVHEQRHAAV
jgi:hypothetical protein